MKRPRFTFKLLAFVLPFIALGGFPLGVLVMTGELLPVSWVVRLNRGDSRFLYGPAYSNPVWFYKLSEVNAQKPRVLALGSSRVMQFRRESFSQPDRFYNAGGAVGQLDQLTLFMQRIKSPPAVVIVGLDQYLFNDNFLKHAYIPPDYVENLQADKRSGIDLLSANWRRIYTDYRAGKFTGPDLGFDFRRLGLGARTYHQGFRSDGSYDYGASLSRDISSRLTDAFTRIEARNERFEGGAEVSSAGLVQVEAFLEHCHRRGIHVVGFLPPFAHVIHSKMLSTGDYDYLARLMPQLRPIFDRYQFTLVECSDLAQVGVDDTAIIDGFHADEEAYRKLLMLLAAQDRVLAAQIVTGR